MTKINSNTAESFQSDNTWAVTIALNKLIVKGIVITFSFNYCGQIPLSKHYADRFFDIGLRHRKKKDKYGA